MWTIYKSRSFFFTSFTQAFFTVLKVWRQKRLSVCDRRWRLGLVRRNSSGQNPLHWLQQGGSSSDTLQGPRGGYCGPAAHPAHQRGEDPRHHLHLQCCQLSLLISLHSQDEVNQIVSSNVRLKQVWYWFSISWCEKINRSEPRVMLWLHYLYRFYYYLSIKYY